MKNYCHINIVRFWAHHANIDRHFESWMKNYASTSRSKYYYFPTKGFAPGCNLKDIISSTDPFLLLSKQRLSMRPYTIKVCHADFIKYYASCTVLSYY